MPRNQVGPFAIVLVVLVATNALWTPVVLAGRLLFPVLFEAVVTPIASIVDAAQIMLALATMVVFASWIYVAGRHLEKAGVRDLEFSAASRIWWFFVPIMNLFKPFQGMRELDNASRGEMPYDRTNGLLGAWWALWLTNSVFGSVFNRYDGNDMVVYAIAAAAEIGLAVTAILLILRIAGGQARSANGTLAEVFA